MVKKTEQPTLDARGNWIGAPEAFALDHCGLTLYQAFNEMTYVVGSALVNVTSVM